MDRAALLLLPPLLLALASATPPICDRYPSLTAGPVQSCSCSAGDPSNPSARIVYTVSIPASCASSTTGGKCGAVLDIHGFNKWERICTRIERLPKVSISVLEGGVVGGGFQLSLVTDVRIAAPQAH